jgi:hypothetical protein
MEFKLHSWAVLLAATLAFTGAVEEAEQALHLVVLMQDVVETVVAAQFVLYGGPIVRFPTLISIKQILGENK